MMAGEEEPLQQLEEIHPRAVNVDQAIRRDVLVLRAVRDFEALGDILERLSSELPSLEKVESDVREDSDGLIVKVRIPFRPVVVLFPIRAPREHPSHAPQRLIEDEGTQAGAHDAPDRRRVHFDAIELVKNVCFIRLLGLE